MVAPVSAVGEYFAAMGGTEGAADIVTAIEVHERIEVEVQVENAMHAEAPIATEDVVVQKFNNDVVEAATMD